MISDDFQLGCCYGPLPNDDENSDKFTLIKGDIQFSTNDTEERCMNTLESFCRMLKSKFQTAFHPEREALFTAAIDKAGGHLFCSEENKHLFI